MTDRKNKFHLTKREREVLDILWESSEPMIASDIASHGNHMTVNTVQAVLKGLLAAELIQVDNIVRTGKVFGRSYTPVYSPEEFELNRIADNSKHNGSISASRFVAAMFEREDDAQKLLSEFDQIEALVKAKRKELLGE